MICDRCKKQASPLFADPRITHRKFDNSSYIITTRVCGKCEKEVWANQDKYRNAKFAKIVKNAKSEELTPDQEWALLAD